MLNRFSLCALGSLALGCTLAGTRAAFSQGAAAPSPPSAPAAAGDPGRAPEVAPTPLAVIPLADAGLALRESRLLDARRLLKSIDPATLSTGDTARWFSLASRTALRLGDTEWLRQINQGGELDENGDTLLILGAMRFLLAGKYASARHVLQSVDQPDRLSEIPRRRYLQLWARLEQLEGRRPAERVYVEKLVNFAAAWPSANCQSCHANPQKYGTEVTTIDMQHWWVGDRFAAILKADGDAVRVREEAAARLKTNPNDAAARLRLAYALRALDQQAASTAELRTLPWTQWPDRERTPLRFGVFP